MPTPAFFPVSDTVSVAPQLDPADMAEVKRAGFRSVINNRPDLEGGTQQPTSAQMEEAAHALGLEYVYQPVDSGNIGPDEARQFRALIDKLPGPVLAYCRSGGRCARLHDAAMALPSSSSPAD